MYVKRRDPRMQLIEENAKKRVEEETKRRNEAKLQQQEKRKQQRAQCVSDAEETQRRAEELSRAFLLGDELNSDGNRSDDSEEADDIIDDPTLTPYSSQAHNNNSSNRNTNMPNHTGAVNQTSNTGRKKSKKKTGRIGVGSMSHRHTEEDIDELLDRKLSEMRLHSSATRTVASEASGTNTHNAMNMEAGVIIVDDKEAEKQSNIVVDSVDGIVEGDAVEGEDNGHEVETSECLLFSCVLCDKHFKSKPQLLQHFNNRTHKKKELEAKRAEKKK